MTDVRFDLVILICVKNGAIYISFVVSYVLTRFRFSLLRWFEQIARSPVEMDQRTEYFTTSVLQHITEEYSP